MSGRPLRHRRRGRRGVRTRHQTPSTDHRARSARMGLSRSVRLPGLRGLPLRAIICPPCKPLPAWGRRPFAHAILHMRTPPSTLRPSNFLPCRLPAFFAASYARPFHVFWSGKNSLSPIAISANGYADGQPFLPLNTLGIGKGIFLSTTGTLSFYQWCRLVLYNLNRQAKNPAKPARAIKLRLSESGLKGFAASVPPYMNIYI